MLNKYLWLCISGGLIHSAYARSSDPLELPASWSSAGGMLLISTISLLSIVAEIIIGIIKINVWVGLFLWIPVDIFVGFIIPRIWVSISFMLGVVLFIVFFISIMAY